MFWFRSFRVWYLLRDINETIGFGSTPVNSLRSLAPDHLSAIAKVANRIHTDFPDTVFHVILPDLAADREAALRLAKVTKKAVCEQFPKELNKQLELSAERVLGHAANYVAKALPKGCRLKKHQARKVTNSLLLQGTEESQVGPLLLMQLRKRPADFIADFDQWSQRQSNAILRNVQLTITAFIPRGCTFDEQRCVDSIREALKSELSAKKVGDGFVERFRGSLPEFIPGYSEWIDTQAKASWEALRPQIETLKPSDHRTEVEDCIRALKACIEVALEHYRSSASPDQVADAFCRRTPPEPNPEPTAPKAAREATMSYVWQLNLAEPVYRRHPDASVSIDNWVVKKTWWLREQALVDLVRNIAITKVEPIQLVNQLISTILERPNDYRDVRVPPPAELREYRISDIRSSAPDQTAGSRCPHR
jgi:hypothetical protein